MVPIRVRSWIASLYCNQAEWACLRGPAHRAMLALNLTISSANMCARLRSFLTAISNHCFSRIAKLDTNAGVTAEDKIVGTIINLAESLLHKGSPPHRSCRGLMMLSFYPTELRDQNALKPEAVSIDFVSTEGYARA